MKCFFDASLDWQVLERLMVIPNAVEECDLVRLQNKRSC